MKLSRRQRKLRKCCERGKTPPECFENTKERMLLGDEISHSRKTGWTSPAWKPSPVVSIRINLNNPRRMRETCHLLFTPRPRFNNQPPKNFSPRPNSPYSLLARHRASALRTHEEKLTFYRGKNLPRQGG